MTFVHDLLRWAAGASVSIPDQISSDISAFDETEFFALLWQHRLSVRFTERVRREKPAWCSVALSVGAWIQAEHVTTHVQQQITAATEMARSLPLAYLDRPPIFVKGFSSYALIGKPDAVRISDDIDVLSADPEPLIGTLKELGYQLYPLNAAHEYANLSRNAVAVEIHSHIPSASYPQRLSTADLIPSHHPHRWTQNILGYEQAIIEYADVIADAHHGRTAETQELLVPSPAMAAFLGCASLFRDFLSAPTYGYVQGALGFLAEITDLVLLPEFDPNAFLQLKDRFQGQDSTAFVSYMLKENFGVSSLPQPPERVASFSSSIQTSAIPFPRQFFWCSVWSILDTSIEELMHPYGGGAAMIERIGANPLVVTPPDSRKYYAIDAPSSGDLISRLLVQHSEMLADERPELPLRFSVTKEADECTVEVCVLKPCRQCGYEVNVFRPCPYPIWIHKEKLVHERQNRTELNETAEGLVFTLRFPWSPFSLVSPLPYQPIILQIEKQIPVDGDGSGIGQIFMTVPIQLYWEKVAFGGANGE